MTLQFTPEEFEQMKVRLELVYAKRLMTVLESVPLASPDERITDAAYREDFINRVTTFAERAHPMPSWRELL